MKQAMDVDAPSSYPKGHDTVGRVSQVRQALDQFLPTNLVSFRKGDGGRNYAYMEGHVAVRMMNAIFGFEGWNSSVLNTEVNYCDENGGRWQAGVSATVRVTVAFDDVTASHEDVGYGRMENGSAKGTVLEKCMKEAVTDAKKRAICNFGRSTGGCLRDRDYLEFLKRNKPMGGRGPIAEGDIYRCNRAPQGQLVARPRKEAIPVVKDEAFSVDEDFEELLMSGSHIA